MCGIFGTFNYRLSKQMIDQCVDLLVHRGPDYKGIWTENEVVFGHRRLSIIDLSENGIQPMHSLDNRYVIVYNGEVYNYIEIRKELQAIGYKFKSDTDTEVVLNAFAEWGEKCLDKFNGMWAFAIWDRLKKRLFIARDRLGVKPLYYHIERNGECLKFCFASEMKALIPLIQNPLYDSKLIMDKGMCFEYESTNNTIIKQIKKIKAGMFAYVDNDNIKEKRWWNTLEHVTNTKMTYDEQVEKLRELFISACKLRMRSDVKVGTALSGGLDSSATISAMAKIKTDDVTLQEDWQNAYTAAFGEVPLDETKYSNYVKEELRLKGKNIRISSEDFINNIEEDIFKFEDVYITPPTPMMRVYEAMKKDGVKVTLDGHGADELFCGYEDTVLSSLQDTNNNYFKVYDVIKTYYGTMSEKDQNWNTCIRPWTKLYKIYQKNNKMKWKKYWRIDLEEAKWNNFDFLNKELYYLTHCSVLPTLLRNYDHYSMSNGVEIRMPFLDYRIVEFAFSINWNSKVRNGYTKAVVRDAMKGIVPMDILKRKSKIGFSSPLLEWMRGPLKEYITDLINSREYLDCELVNYKSSKTRFDYLVNSPNATQIDAESMWVELQPFLWKKYFFDRIRNVR